MGEVKIPKPKKNINKLSEALKSNMKRRKKIQAKKRENIEGKIN